MPPSLDEDLVQRIRTLGDHGDRRRLAGELFERHYERVALWCLRYADNREEARDLAQEVFMKAYQALDNFQGEAKFSTWLYVIARHHCINAIRSRREKFASQPVEEMAEEGLGSNQGDQPGIDEQIDLHASLTSLRRWMKQELDETERQVVTMHFVHEMPLQAITQRLRLSNASGAKAFVVSARRKLARAAARDHARQERSREEARGDLQ